MPQFKHTNFGDHAENASKENTSHYNQLIKDQTLFENTNKQNTFPSFTQSDSMQPKMQGPDDVLGYNDGDENVRESIVLCSPATNLSKVEINKKNYPSEANNASRDNRDSGDAIDLAGPSGMLKLKHRSIVDDEAKAFDAIDAYTDKPSVIKVEMDEAALLTGNDHDSDFNERDEQDDVMETLFENNLSSNR